MNTVWVLGAGSWGTALALHIARQNPDLDVVLWARNATHVQQMRDEGANSRYLPGEAFPPNLQVSDDLAESHGVRDVLISVPSEPFADVLEQLMQVDHRRGIAWATKGLLGQRLLHSIVAAYEVPMAVLSGPTFAKEIAAGKPSALVVAASDAAFAQHWVNRLHKGLVRAYATDDLAGVQLGGAVKNVFAIAAGCADGLGFGANTRAALITRGLAEVQRLNAAVGGRSETIMGLAGMGDLVLTCTDNLSRNRRCGLLLADGKSVAQACEEIGQVVEGVTAAKEVKALAADLQVEMPIVDVVYRVLYEALEPKAGVSELIARAPTQEFE